MDSRHYQSTPSTSRLLNEARLTDSPGNVVNFKNTVIIMTSILGSQYFNDLPPDSPVTADAKEAVLSAVRAHLLP